MVYRLSKHGSGDSIIMNMEWIYENLVTIIVILCVATTILFIFPVILGWDLMKKGKVTMGIFRWQNPKLGLDQFLGPVAQLDRAAPS